MRVCKRWVVLASAGFHRPLLLPLLQQLLAHASPTPNSIENVELLRFGRSAAAAAAFPPAANAGLQLTP